MVTSNRKALVGASATALCAAAYLIPYFHLSTWWRFIPSTGIILLTGAVVFRGGALRFFGLQLTARDVVTTLALFGIALLASRYVLSSYVETYLEVVRAPTVRARVHQFFQVLNDELVMRAALLTLVLGVMPRPKVAIISLAILFAVAHWLFYGLGGVALEPSTLLTLFALGVIGNTLFVAYGHIGYGLALHYAWNFYRFNTRYYLDGRRLREGETFNYIEGNPWVLGVSMILMLLVFSACVRWGRRSSPAPVASPTRPQ